MSVTIDSLEIKIASDSRQASKSIDELISSLRELKTVCTGGAGLKDVANGLNALNKELNHFNTTKAKKELDSLKQSAEKTKQTLAPLQNPIVPVYSHYEQIPDDAFDDLYKGMGKTSEVSDTLTKSLEKTDQELKRKPGDAKKASDAFSKLRKGAMKGSEGLGYFLNSLKRIMMYRGIYAIMKVFEDGLAEGVSNAYQFARIMKNDIATTMDSVAAHTYRMKNQLGAMATQLLSTISPILIRLADLVNVVLSKITEVLAAFNGQDTYLKANLVSKTWEEAKDSLNDYKKSLSGLDELNNIGKQKNVLSYDYKDLYDNAKVSDNLKWLGGIKVVIDSIGFELGNLSEELIKADLTSALIGAGIGFVATGGNFGGAIVGAIIGTALEMQIKEFEFKLAEGDFSVQGKNSEIAEILTEMGAGALIGFEATKTARGAIIGAVAGALITLNLNQLDFSQGRKAYSSDTMGKKLKKALGTLTGGLIGWKLTGNTEGALLGASIGSIITMGLTSVAFENWIKGADTQEVATLAVGAISAATGGILTLRTTGSGKSALISGAMLASINMGIISSIWSDKSNKSTQEKAIESFAAIVGGLIGGYIGYTFTGGNVQGAIWGFTIGAKITVSIKEIIFDLIGTMGNAQSDINNWLKTTFGIDVSDTDAGKLGDTAKAYSLYKSTVNGTSTSTSLPSSDSNFLYDYYKQQFGNDTAFMNVIKSLGNSYSMPYGTQNEIVEIIKRAKANGVKGFAHGGYVGGGHLFFANENGNPEYIGNMGGTTAVANSDQMAEAIEGASYRGMARALQQYGSQNGGSYEPMSGDDMFVFLRKKATSYTQRTGNPAFN